MKFCHKDNKFGIYYRYFRNGSIRVGVMVQEQTVCLSYRALGSSFEITKAESWWGKIHYILSGNVYVGLL